MAILKPFVIKGLMSLNRIVSDRLIRLLLSDTKLTKNRPENIRVHIDVTRDVSEVAHRCADVHCDEVAGCADVQSFLGFA